MTKATLARETFRTSRLLEYFSEKELTLQTGHEPERWTEVVVKELIDNALDACEEAGTLPEITLAIDEHTISVQDNGPGLPGSVIDSILDYSVRASSKDAYISPTRGAQGNALKTVVAIPYVLSGCQRGEISITSKGQRHRIVVTVDRIAQEPTIQSTVERDGLVRTGTRVTVIWPDSACSELAEAKGRFLQVLDAYGLFNPHGTFVLKLGKQQHRLKRTAATCAKWVASEPTSPHWYTADQLRALMAAYLTVERDGGQARTVRQFIAEFRGLSGTAKQKAILSRLPIAGVHLRDFVRNGDVDRGTVETLLEAMRAESRAVKPDALGVLGEAHVRAWLLAHGGLPQTLKYKRIAGMDDESGLPFVVELGWAVRQSNINDAGAFQRFANLVPDLPGSGRRRVMTGINFAPTLVDPFRALDDYGFGLDGFLSSLHIEPHDPVTVMVHLTCPHLNYTDRGKSSLEAL